MNRQLFFRIILNLVLIGIAVVSVAAVGFVSFMGYRSNSGIRKNSDPAAVEETMLGNEGGELIMEKK